MAKKTTTKRAPMLTGIPEGFGLTERVRTWAAAKLYDRLDEHLESFLLKCEANGYRYASWEAALMTAIRDDWAGLRKTPRWNGGGAPAPRAQPDDCEFVDRGTAEPCGMRPARPCPTFGMIRLCRHHEIKVEARTPMPEAVRLLAKMKGKAA